MQKRQQGDLAESLAKSWLQHHGYRFITQNFNRRVGEIDLIFEHPDRTCIVFVEVRFRSCQHYGGAVASVDWKKQRKLVRAANAWLQSHASSRTAARIDVLAVQTANENTPSSRRWHDHELTWIVNAIEE